MVPGNIDKVIQIGTAIASFNDYAKLFRYVIAEIVELIEAEGGTLYLYDEDRSRLAAVVAINNVLGLEHSIEEFEPANIKGLFTLPIDTKVQSQIQTSVAAMCWQQRKTVIVPDSDAEDRFDLSAMRSFDEEYGYKSRSLVVMPLLTREGKTLGVVQLVNTPLAVGHSSELQMVETLVRYMGLALENSLLLLSNKILLDSVVEMVSEAIDAKSQSTSGHCERVTKLTLMMADAMAADETGPYREFRMSKEERDELQTAALLHDVGKITTPNHVMDKSKKLEKVFDKIAYLRMRHLLRKERARVNQLKRELHSHSIAVPMDDAAGSEDEDFRFIETVNVGGEYLDEDTLTRLREIAERSTPDGPLIEYEDLQDLEIRRGTLNQHERDIMMDHAAVSIRLLSKLPWPAHFSQVTEIAGKHHENCDGSGYPLGVSGDDMSIRAKILSLVDRFEGISAPDRTYRKKKTFAQVIKIMEGMSSGNQIDPVMFRFFLDSGVCADYANEHLSHLFADGQSPEKELAELAA